MKDWLADLAVGLIGFGIAAALVAWQPWTALPILVIWVVVNERRIKIENHSPPPPVAPIAGGKQQVTRQYNGAQVTVYPPEEQREYKV